MAVDYKEFQRHAAERRKSIIKKGGAGGGGGTPSWAMRMKYYSPSAIPTRIRLLPYRPGRLWFRYMSRWVKITVDGKQVSRNVIGNSHNGELDVPDLLYYYMITNENEQLMASPSDIVTIAALEQFHKVKKGTSRKGRDYYDLVRCEGVDRFNVSKCQLCKDGSPTEFGNQYHWSFWPNAQQQFMDELALIPRRCCNCFKGEISVHGYSCAKCGVELASHYKGGIEPDVEKAFRDDPTTCPHCKETAKAEHLIECVIRHGEGESAQYSEGCQSPKRPPAGVDPWEYDLWVAEEKVGQATAIRITKFAPPMDGVAPALLQPMEFNDFFSHMTLDEQAKNLGRPNVFGPAEQEAVDAFFAKPPAQPVAPDAEDTNSVPWGAKKTEEEDLPQ
jgi:hypothetical protein